MSAKKPEPPPPTAPIKTDDVPWQEFKHGEDFHIRYRSLSESMGAQPYKVGVVIEELLPGKQNNPAHWHHREEEHVLVLAGELTVRIGKEHHVMKAGDYVRFPAGAPYEHCLYNHSKDVCRYVLIGEQDPHEVCVYPDSNKISVRAEWQVFGKADEKDYWAGEGTLTGKKG
jgi:uncharacterized cupin superfamily protein